MNGCAWPDEQPGRPPAWCEWRKWAANWLPQAARAQGRFGDLQGAGGSTMGVAEARAMRVSIASSAEHVAVMGPRFEGKGMIQNRLR